VTNVKLAPLSTIASNNDALIAVPQKSLDSQTR
jgi:hypothetical protein